MNQTTYKVVKLVNGEELICELSNETTNGEYEIGFPLRMTIHSQPAQNGTIDNLNLSRWISPYTEQSYFTIKKEHIIIIATASIGLSRYYKHIMSKIDDHSLEEKNLLDDIDDNDVYDELLAQLDTSSKLIH